MKQERKIIPRMAACRTRFLIRCTIRQGTGYHACCSCTIIAPRRSSQLPSSPTKVPIEPLQLPIGSPMAAAVRPLTSRLAVANARQLAYTPLYRSALTRRNGTCEYFERFSCFCCAGSKYGLGRLQINGSCVKYDGNFCRFLLYLIFLTKTWLLILSISSS